MDVGGYDMAFYTYILQCADNTLYTGYTIDLKKRLDKHNSGNGAKYTRNRRPVSIVWSAIFETKSEAMKNECRIKRMTHKQKLDFIKLANRNK